MGEEDRWRVHKVSIGRRLTVCFVLIVLVMSAGTGLLLWQSHLVRVQANRLNGVDEELIAVLRFQTSLRAFGKRLNEIARSEDTSRVFEESEKLRVGLIDDARQTQAAFDDLSSEVTPDPALLATLEAV